ncbi:MAG: hypothetical protein ACLR1A_07275 [Eubacterium ventriosum]
MYISANRMSSLVLETADTKRFSSSYQSSKVTKMATLVKMDYYKTGKTSHI